jgi:hypothetical protein
MAAARDDDPGRAVGQDADVDLPCRVGEDDLAVTRDTERSGYGWPEGAGDQHGHRERQQE